MEIINIQPTTEAEIKTVEQTTGLHLTESFKAFILEYNGGIPQHNHEVCSLTIEYEDGYKTSTFVENLISMQEVTRQWENVGYLEELAAHFELTREYVEVEKLFPIANLANGVAYIALGGKHKGKIYIADNGDFGIVYHCASMNDFLANLESEQVDKSKNGL